MEFFSPLAPTQKRDVRSNGACVVRGLVFLSPCIDFSKVHSHQRPWRVGTVQAIQHPDTQGNREEPGAGVIRTDPAHCSGVDAVWASLRDRVSRATERGENRGLKYPG